MQTLQTSRAVHTLPAACRSLSFVRHGATEPNLAGLRCGGDLDVPLTDTGRQQAADVARRLVAMGRPVGVIITSDLQRTRETARIVAQALPGVEVIVEPGFAERHLGTWNLRAIAETEVELMRGDTPPGGESTECFFDRIASAIETVLPLLDRRPLLVGSKGVARALGELLGQPAQGLANGALARFELAAFARHRPHNDQRCPA
jgi:2,3-bisphosphoglycerate-dependent phosphoglycerate mutase